MDNVQNVTESQNLKGGKSMKKSTKILLIVLSVIFMLTAVIVPVVVFTAPKDPGYIQEETDNFLLRYRPGEDYYDIVLYTGTDENVVVPAEINGVRVRNILQGAFSAEERSSNKNIKTVTLEVIREEGTNEIIGGIEKIGERAFEGCSSLTSFEIPVTVTTLSAEAFSGSGISRLVVKNADTLKLEPNALKGADKLTTLAITAGGINSDNLTNYGSGSNIDNIEIGSNVSEVTMDAFNGFSAMTTLSVYNIDTLNLDSMGDTENSITTLNILASKPVLTKAFMDKIGIFCGKTVNTINIYPEISVIEAGVFASENFTQLRDNGGDIYISDSAVIDLGSINVSSSSYDYKIHLHQLGEDSAKEKYSLNISANNDTTVTSEFFNKFDSDDLAKVNILNFSGLKVAIDENGNLKNGVLTTSYYKDENNAVVVNDRIATFEQYSLSNFNYNEGCLEYIIFGDKVNDFSDLTFGISQIPQSFASNVSESGVVDDKLAFVNIYGPDNYESVIYQKFNRVINSTYEDGTENVYKTRFLSRASYNGETELGSRFITFNYITDETTTNKVEAQIGKTLEVALGTGSEISGYKNPVWYTNSDLTGEIVEIENVVVTHEIADTYYAQCTPVSINYKINLTYGDKVTEENLVYTIDKDADGNKLVGYYGQIIDVKALIAGIKTDSDPNGCIKDSNGNYVPGFDLDNNNEYTVKITETEEGSTQVITINFVRPSFKIQFNYENDSNLDSEITVKYGDNFTFPVVTRNDGYFVNTWTSDYLGTVEVNQEGETTTKLFFNIDNINNYINSNYIIRFNANFLGEVVEDGVTFKYFFGEWDTDKKEYVKLDATELAQSQTITSLNGKQIRVGDSFDCGLQDLDIVGYSYIKGQTYVVVPDENDGTVSNIVEVFYEKNTYKLVFNTDGGTISVTDIVTKQIGDDFNNLPTASKTGYTFAGWKLNDNSQILVSFKLTADVITKNVENDETNEYKGIITLTATYTPNTYTVNVYLNDTDKNQKEIWNTYKLTYNTLKEIDNPTIIGYRLTGWDVTGAIDGYTCELNGSKTKLLNLHSETTDVGETTGVVSLVANWIAIKYTIIANLDGGKLGEAEPDSTTINYGEGLLLEAPTKDFHYFTGWTITGAIGDYTYSIDDETMEATFKNLSYIDGAEVTITANWAPNSYTLNFNVNGGEGSKDSITFEYNQKAENSDNYLEIDFRANSITAPTGSTLTGWVYNGKTITASEHSVDALFNSTDTTSYLGLPSTGNKDGYTLTLDAVYTYIQYSIKVNVGAGEIKYDKDGDGEDETYTSGDNELVIKNVDYTKQITIKDPTRTGYTFDGWDKTGTDNGTSTTFVNLIDKNEEVVITANWTPNTYKVIILDSADDSVIRSYEVKFDETQTITIDDKNGAYTFDGLQYVNGSLYSGAIANGSNFDDKSVLEGTNITIKNLSKGSESKPYPEITFKALWITGTYYVETTRNGVQQTYTPVNYDDEYTLTIPTREGYTFNNFTVSNYDTENALIWNGTEYVKYEGQDITAETKFKYLQTSGTVTFVEDWTPNEITFTVNYYVSKVVAGATTYINLTDLNNYEGKVTNPNVKTTTGTKLKLSEIINDFHLSGDYETLLRDFGFTDDLYLQNGDEEVTIGYENGQVLKVNLLFARPYVQITFDEGVQTGATLANGKNTKVYYSYITPSESGNTLPLDIFEISQYKITGWTLDGATVTDVNDVISKTGSTLNATATLVAIWEAREYNIDYVLNDNDSSFKATLGEYKPTTANIDQVIQISNPTRPGYTFNGWKLNTYNSVYSGTTAESLTQWNSGLTKNTFFKNLTNEGSTVTLTADWTENTYNVSFYTNKDDSSALKTATRQFLNNEDISFENWIEEANKNKVAYRFVQAYLVGDTDVLVTLNDCTIVELLELVYGNDTTKYNNTLEFKFYATWEAYNYNVSFNTNGTGNVNPITFTIDTSTVTVPGGVGLVNDGYTFAGWVNEKGTLVESKEYTDITDLLTTLGLTTPFTTTENTDTQNIELTATWTENKYNIVFDTNGGSFTDGYLPTVSHKTESITFVKEVNGTYTATVPYTAVVTIVEPTLAGSEFKGWYIGETNVEEFTKLSTGSKESPYPTVTLTAKWGENTYEVQISTSAYVKRGTGEYAAKSNFNATLITENNVKNFEFDEEFTATAEKTGYTFKGWSTTSADFDANTALAGGNTWDGSFVESDTFKKLASTKNAKITLIPYFVENQYVVVVGGNETNCYFTDAINPTYTTPTGYTFTGWVASGDGFNANTALAGGNTWDGTSTTFTSFNSLSTGTETIPDNPDNKASVTVTLTAKFDPNKYTINLDANGGELTGASSYPGTFNDEVGTEIPAPQYTGRTFAGWVVESGTLYTDGATVNGTAWTDGNTRVGADADSVVVKNLVSTNGSIKLKAQWTVNTYNVQIMIQLGDSYPVEHDKINIAYTEERTILATSQNGYGFVAFSATGLTEDTSSYKISDSWVEEWDGTKTSTTATSITFKQLNSNGKDQDGNLPEVVLILHYAPGEYSVRAESDTASTTTVSFENGNYSNSKELLATTGNTVTVYAKVNTGYKFVKDEKEKIFTIVGGGDKAKLENVSEVEGTNGTIYSVEVTGYTETFTVIATAQPIKYNIVFDLDNGKFEESVNTEYAYTDEFTLPVPVRPGYTFKGWESEDENLNSAYVKLSGATEFTSWDGSEIIDEESSVVFKSLTNVDGATIKLDATWYENKYTIAFNLDGGVLNSETSPANRTVNYTTTESISNPTRDGYIFNGWVLGDGDLNTEYAVAGSVDGWAGTETFATTFAKLSVGVKENNESNYPVITLKATWGENQYKITYDLNGDGELDEYDGAIYTASYDDTITIAIPEINGYTFDGWLLSSVDGSDISSAMAGNNSWTSGKSSATETSFAKLTLTPATTVEDALVPATVLLTATWKANTYTLVTVVNSVSTTYYGYYNDGTINESNLTLPTDSKYKNPIGVADPSPAVGYYFDGFEVTTGTLVNESIAYNPFDGEEVSWTTGLIRSVKFKNTIYGNAAGTASITLTAKFELNSYAVETNIDGTISTPVIYKYNDVVELPIPTKDGYTFKGWVADEDYSIYSGAQAGTSADALVAWASANHETATYFKYLSTGIEYTDELGCTVVRLKATWTEHKYNVTFNLGDDKFGGEFATTAPTYTYKDEEGNDKTENFTLKDGVYTATVPYSATIAITDPTGNGYKFDGWSDGENIVTEFVNLSTGSKDSPYSTVTLTATYLPESYEVSASVENTTVGETDSTLSDSTIEKTVYTESTFVIYASAVTGYHNVAVTFVSGTADYEIEEVSDNLYKITFSDYKATFEAKVYSTVNTYKVNVVWSWTENGEKESESVNYIENQPYTSALDVIDLPSKDGYTFTGWEVTNFTTGATANNEAIVNGNKYGKGVQTGVVFNKLTNVNEGEVTLTAVFVPNKYLVSFDFNDVVSTILTETYTYDKNESIEEPTRNGYTFTGWTVKSGTLYTDGAKVDGISWTDGSTPVGQGKASIIIKNLLKGVEPNAEENDTTGYPEITLQANWEAKDANYVVEIYISNVNKDTGEYAEGYSNEFTFTHISKTDTVVDNAFITAEHNLLTTGEGELSEYTDYLTFNSAKTTEANDGVSVINYNETTVIKMYYDRVTIEVTFTTTETDINGESLLDVTKTYAYDLTSEKELSLNIFVIDGKTLTGWLDEGNENVTLINELIELYSDIGSVTLTAVWNTNAYTVKFEEIYNDYKESVTGIIGDDEEVAGVDLKTLPTRDGYTFTGWVLSADDTTILANAQYKADGTWTDWDDFASVVNATEFMNLSNRVGSTVTLTAQWSENLYTITLISPLDNSENIVLANNVGYENTNTFSISNSTSFTAPDGQHFSHWVVNGKTIVFGTDVSAIDYTIAEFVEEYYTSPYSVKDIEITPVWVDNTYTITFNLDGGKLDENETPASKTQNFSAVVNINNPTKTGYTFAGWVASSVTSTTAQAYYNNEWITWSEYETMVTAALAGDLDMLAEVGKITVFTKLASKVINNESITLKANWIQHHYTVIIDLGDSTYGGNFETLPTTKDGVTFTDNEDGTYTATILYTDVITIHNPKFVGYTFAGWDVTGTKIDGAYTFTKLSEGSNVDPYPVVTITVNTPTPIQYIVHVFDSEEEFGKANSTDYSEYTFTYGEEITVVTPTINNYTFNAWVADASTLTKTAQILNGTTWEGWEGAETKILNFRNLTTSTTDPVKLLAKFVGNLYNVKLDLDYGTTTGSDTLTVNFGTNVLAHSNYVEPTRKGFVFKGWASEDIDTRVAKSLADGRNWTTWDGSVTTASIKDLIPTNIAPNGTVTENETVTLKAQWEAIQYEIVYNSNHTSASGTMVNGSFKYTDSNVTITNNKFENTGWEFKGWSLTQTVSDVTNFTSGVVGGVDAITFLNTYGIDPDTTTEINLYAIWSENTYNVTINTNDGTFDINNSGVVEQDELPYYTHNSETTSFTYNEGNATYTATVPYTATIVLSEINKTGYTFGGWSQSGTYDSSAKTYSFTKLSATDNANVTISVTWNNNTYTVYFNLDGGTSSSALEQLGTFDGDLLDNPATDVTFNKPSKDGYTFAGWVVESGTLYTTGATVNGTAWTNGNTRVGADANSVVFRNLVSTNGSITLKATWTEHKYNVTFNVNDGTFTSAPTYTHNSETTSFTYNEGNVTYTATVPYTATITIEDPERVGYTFDGWYNGATKVTSFTQLASKVINNESITLTANWTPNEYTIKIDLNDADNEFKATLVDGTSYTAKFDLAKTINAPTRTGHTFLGWVVGEGTIYTGATATGITGNWNGTEAVGSNLQPVDFKNLSVGVTPNNDKIGYPVIKLKANWSVNTYNISINLNDDDSDSKAELTTQINNPYAFTADAIELAEPTRTGYTFAGWEISNLTAKVAKIDNVVIESTTFTTSKKSITLQYLNANNGDETKTVTFKAIWTENSYKLTINPNGGTFNVAPTYTYKDAEGTEKTGNFTSANKVYVATTVPYTATIILDEPEYTGRTFDGWYNGDTKITTFTMLSTGDDVTLIAKWNVNTYTVTIDANSGTFTSAPTYTYKNAEGEDVTTSFTYNEGNGTYTATVPYTATITIADPTKVGHSFKGWDVAGTDNGTTTTYTVATLVTNSTLTITANDWEAIIYPLNIKYVVYGNENVTYTLEVGGATVEKVEGTYGSNVPFTVNVSNGSYYYYLTDETIDVDDITISTLVGLNSGTFDWTFTAEEDQSMTIYLYQVYTVNYDVNTIDETLEGTAPETEYLLIGGTITLPENTLTRTGHTAKGWTTVSTGVYDETPESSYTASGTTIKVTFYANWFENSYKLNVDLNDDDSNVKATLSTTIASSYKFTTEFTVAEPTRTGYTFTGWTVADYNTSTALFDTKKYDVEGVFETVTINNVDYIVTKATTFAKLSEGSDVEPYPVVTITANWVENKYNVIFDLDDGTLDIDNSGVVEQDELPYYTHSIDGKVYFNNNNGTYTATVPYTATITIADPTRDGYTFLGWGAGEHDETEKVTTFSMLSMGSKDTPYPDVRITAQFDVNTYTIVYNKNHTSASGTMVNGSFKYTDSNVTITNNKFENTGWEFKGWSLTQTVSDVTNFTSGVVGGVDAITFLNTYGIDPDTTTEINLYAIWQEKTYKVTFDLEGGTYETAPTYTHNSVTTSFTYNEVNGTYTATVPYTSKINVSGVPERTGYTFNGYLGSGVGTNIAYYTINSGVLQSWNGSFIEVSDYETITFQTLNAESNAVTISATTANGGWTEHTYDSNITVVIDGEVTSFSGSYGSIEFGKADLTNGQYTIDNLPFSTILTLNAPERTGYTFKGWKVSNYDKNTALFGGNKTETANEFVTTATTFANLTPVNNPETPVTIEAVWEINTYTLTVNFADINTSSTNTQIISITVPTGVTASKTSITKDSSVTFTADYAIDVKEIIFTLAGYYLGFTNNADTITTENALGEITLRWVSAPSSDEENVIVGTTSNNIAASQQYTVTFNTNGGSGTLPGEDGVVYLTHGTTINLKDSTINEVANPYFNNLTRSGYEANGWYTESTYTNNPTASYTATGTTTEVTFYANWKINSFTLTINLDDVSRGTEENLSVSIVINRNGSKTTSSFAETYTLSKDYGDTVSIELKLAGYKLQFTGDSNWSDTLTYNWTEYPEDGTTELTINAIQVYTVTFDANGGTGDVPSDKELLYGDSLSLTGSYANNLEITGYTADGWTRGGNAVSSVTASGTETTIALVAKFVENKYNVTFDLDGGTTETPTVNKEDSNEPVVTTGTYTLSNILYTATITIKDPTKRGYSFNGWSVTGTDNGTSTIFTKLSLGTKDSIYPTVTITAKWIENKYNVTFNVNGGTFISAPTVNKEDSNEPVVTTGTYTLSNILYTATITIADPTRDGYTFLGWYNGNTQITSFTNLSTGAKESPYPTVILTAKWEEHRYNVTFDINDGTLDIDNSGVVEQDELPYYTHSIDGKVYFNNNDDGTYTATVPYTATITIADPEQTGWSFTGWTIDKGNTSTTLYNSKVYNDYEGTSEFEKLTATKNGSVILTANWTENVYNVTVKTSYGTIDEIPYVVTTKDYFDVITENKVFKANIAYTQSFKVIDVTLLGYRFTGWTVYIDGVEKYYDTNTTNGYTTFDASKFVEYGATKTSTIEISVKLLVPEPGDDEGLVPELMTLDINYAGLFATNNVDLKVTVGENTATLSRNGTSRYTISAYYGTPPVSLTVNFAESSDSYYMDRSYNGSKKDSDLDYSDYTWEVRYNNDGEIVYELNYYIYQVYTLTYMNNSNSLLKTYSVLHGEDVELDKNYANNQELAGYTANGWQTNNNQLVGTRVEKLTKVTSNTTVYTNWTENLYNMSVYPQGGTMTTPTTDKTGVTFSYDNTTLSYSASTIPFTAVITLPVPSRVGYTFAGWVASGVTSTTAQAYYNNEWIAWSEYENMITAALKDNLDMLTNVGTITKFRTIATSGNVTFTAQWVVNKVKLTVETKTDYGAEEGILTGNYQEPVGGTVAVYQPDTETTALTKTNGYYSVKHGASGIKVKLVATPNNGYTFVGWFTSSGSAISIDQSGNITTKSVGTNVIGSIDTEKSTTIKILVPENLTIVAIFKADIYDVNVSVRVRYAQSSETGAFVHPSKLTVTDPEGILADGEVTLNKWMAGTNIAKSFTVDGLYNSNATTNDNTIYTIKVARTGNLTNIVSNLKSGYSYVGYSTTDYAGQNTVGSDTGITKGLSYTVDNVTADSSIYYYVEANHYDLNVEYGEDGTWVEDGIIQTVNAKTIIGLISNVKYAQTDIVGDAYKVGYKYNGLTINTTKYTDKIWQSLADESEVSGTVEWILATIWITAKDENGAVIAEGANMETGTFTRYCEDINALQTYLSSGLIDSMEVVLVSGDPYTLTTGLTISAGQDVVFKLFNETDKVIVANLTTPITVQGTLTIESGIEIRIPVSVTGTLIQVNNGGTFNFYGDMVGLATAYTNVASAVINGATGSTINVSGASFTNVNGKNVINAQGEFAIKDTTFTDNYTDTDVVIGTV